jgi:hypothetical protein
MDAGKHCPACKLDIGVWPIIKGGLISLSGNRIRCPHCRTRLKYVGWGIDAVFAVMMLPVFVGVMVISFAFIPWYQWERRSVLGVLLLALSMPPVVLASALYLRKHGSLMTVQDSEGGPKLPGP